MNFEQALQREIRRVRERLAEITGIHPKVGRRRPPATRRRRKAPGKRIARRSRGAASKSGRPISAKRRKQMVEQGRYMAAVRRLTIAQRQEVKKTRSDKGMSAALAQAKKFAAKAA